MADGMDHVFVSDKFPLFAASGKPYALCGIAADITERKQAEAKLRESEIRFHNLSDAMPQLVWTANSDGMVDYYNARSVEYGVTVTSHTSEGWAPAVHPDDLAPTLAAWREAVERGLTYQIEHRLRVSDGSYRWHLSRAKPQRDGNGVVVKWFGTATDIHDLKQAEQALLRSEKLASVGRMAATIAHEINNPLEAVMSLLFVVKSSKDPESTRQYLEMADGELKRIAHITRQSLGFYRESNAPALTSVNAVLESAVDLLKNKIKAKGAVIEKQWEKDVMVIAVAGELRQVFSNLLTNSLDAVDEKGTIKLRVSTGPAFKNGDRCVRVTVADNGKGIRPSSRQHLFEPFFTTKGTTGTGLGLWVSKEIIEKHGGVIRVRSSINGARRGTVFSIVLPAEPTVAVRSQSAGA